MAIKTKVAAPRTRSKPAPVARRKRPAALETTKRAKTAKPAAARKPQRPALAAESPHPKKPMPSKALTGVAKLIAEVDALTWTGQPVAAIERATAALSSGDLTPEQQSELLDLRAENHSNRGEMDRLAADTDALAALAKGKRSASLQARALIRRAFLHRRRGEIAEGLAASRSGNEATQRSGRRRTGGPGAYGTCEALVTQHTELTSPSVTRAGPSCCFGAWGGRAAGYCAGWRNSASSRLRGESMRQKLRPSRRSRWRGNAAIFRAGQRAEPAHLSRT